MKVLIIFLSLVGVSCVTANTRDLSAINPQTESLKSEPVSATSFKLADGDACITSCLEDGHPHSDCSDACSDWGYSGVENKKPLMLAGFDECVDACKADGYNEDGCRSACR